MTNATNDGEHFLCCVETTHCEKFGSSVLTLLIHVLSSTGLHQEQFGFSRHVYALVRIEELVEVPQWHIHVVTCCTMKHGMK